MNPSQPEPVAGEHNPDGLTPEQYGAPEWRLLREMELLQLGDEWKSYREIKTGADWRPINDGYVGFGLHERFTYRRRVTATAQTWEQTPESAEVKACPSEWIVEPMTEKVAAGLFRDGELVAVGNGEVSNSVFRKIADMMNAESSSLASLQQENEKYKDCFNEMRDEAVRLRDERDQLRAEVERLTKENEVQSHEIRLISDHRDQLMRERDEARERDGTVPYEMVTELRSALATAQEERESLKVQLAEREEDRWQEIETAPKDGHFLGFVKWGEGIEECSFVCYYSRHYARFAIVCAEKIRCEITHWQPLPKPPAIRSARGATPEGTPQEAEN